MRSLVPFAVVFALSCSRLRPPTIAPEKAVLTSIGPNGVTLDVELGVDNPNAVELSGRSVTARVRLDGTHDLGTVDVPQRFKLASHARSHLVVPLSIKWADLSLLASLVLSNRPISYDVDGTVNLGGDLLSAEVPFHLNGVITHEQLVQATMSSMPPILPR